MLVLATVLMILGVVLLLGPTLLSWFLMGVSSIVPASWGTVIYLMVLITVYMILVAVLKGTYGYFDDREKKRVARNRRNKVNSIMAVMHAVTFLSFFFIILNGPFIRANEGWKRILLENSETFSVMRYIGIVLCALSIGFFLGKRYKDHMENEPIYPVELADGAEDVGEATDEDDTPRYHCSTYGDEGEGEDNVIKVFPRTVSSDFDIHLPVNARETLS